MRRLASLSRFVVALSLILALPALRAQDTAGVKPLDARLTGYDYPYPVQMYGFKSQGDAVQMAYMDVQPLTANGKVALLLHGKNFCSAYWKPTIMQLTKAGYRVIAPDQIGFCKSSKPHDYQYSLEQLAENTHALLASLNVDKVTVIGHSMGGMLAIRYALMYPSTVDQLVLVDPIGLESGIARGVPYRDIDTAYAKALKTDYASIKRYQMKHYYGGHWSPAYAQWAQLQAGMYAGPGRDAVAWAAARTSDMIQTQPVAHELGDIRVPTTLIVGTADRITPGADRAPPGVARMLQNYRRQAVLAADTIPDAHLIKLDGVGHVPQVQAPDRFAGALGDALGLNPQGTPAAASSAPVAAGTASPPAPPAPATSATSPAPETSAPAAGGSSAPAPASTRTGHVDKVMKSNATDRDMRHDMSAPATTTSSG